MAGLASEANGRKDDEAVEDKAAEAAAGSSAPTVKEEGDVEMMDGEKPEAEGAQADPDIEAPTRDTEDASEAPTTEDAHEHTEDLSDELRPEDAIDSGTRDPEPSGTVDEAAMEIQKSDDEGADGADGTDEDSQLDDSGDSHSEHGKRVKSSELTFVKVYELRDQSWFDRGTGYCKGVFDEAQELALLIVEKEDADKAENGEAEAPGGFLKDELLLSSRVEKDDIYGRQQDTLIVWTELTTGLDIALSFQDAEGCEDIWGFITEVQKHLNNHPAEDAAPAPSSSSPMTASPMLGSAFAALNSHEAKTTWQTPTLANIKEQEMLLRMQTKSQIGRERATEHIVSEEYIKALIQVFDQAEDLESLADLHSLCAIMHIIILLNDTNILEQILQDDIYEGVLGILEYDPDYPSLKASFRQIYKEVSQFHAVADIIRDTAIKEKISQTYRLQYLKEVVLARLLDDPTFGILNGHIFYNQVDIIQHIQSDFSLLSDLFQEFDPSETTHTSSEEKDEKLKRTVLFLHQVMLIGKSLQLPARLALFRSLLDRGLLIVCEWALSRPEANIVHAAAEMLTLMVDHDISLVRAHVLKEEEAKRKTLIMEMISMMCGPQGMKNLGLLSQMGDIFRNLLEPGEEVRPVVGRSMFQRKDTATAEAFINYVYENCVAALYKPLLDLPDIKPDMEPAFKLTREQSTLLQLLIELLSYGINNHAHRASYFILSNPISKKVVGLLYIKDKPLRHAALRYVRACLRAHNHFIHRNFAKNDLLQPVLALLDEEGSRDNMLSSSCMELLDLIRRDNLKVVIKYMFEQYQDRILALSQRPYLRNVIRGIETRWEQMNEPPPPLRTNTWTADDDEKEAAGSSKREAEVSEEKYFNDASDEEEETRRAAPAATASTSTSPGVGNANKRRRQNAETAQGRQRSRASASASSPSSSSAGKKEKAALGPTKTTVGESSSGSPGGSNSKGSLGLDNYDDGSDSDSSSSGARSPRSAGPSQAELATASLDETMEEVEEGLGDVAMKVRAKRLREEEEEEEGFGSLLVKPPPSASPSGSSSGSGSVETGAKASPGGSQTKAAKGPAATTTRGSSSIPKKVVPEKREGSALQEMGKKIKLNFGGLGRRLGGGGSGSSSSSGTSSSGAGEPSASSSSLLSASDEKETEEEKEEKEK